MDFKTYFNSLSVAERETLAKDAGSTVGTLTNVAYGKKVELGFADVIVALSRRKVTLDELPLTDSASRQRLIREASRTKRRARAPLASAVSV